VVHSLGLIEGMVGDGPIIIQGQVGQVSYLVAGRVESHCMTKRVCKGKAEVWRKDYQLTEFSVHRLLTRTGEVQVEPD